ncbi:hypothetical protein LTR09_011678 [Extremus antarcticus]|uniref:Uncharacterized protein n=1 Tax=Extremus antarcticus TaxID=702011 RepID=A0AAJ0D5S1_9PEZI|nr:hypothetical protein LTR09_011678 [Extremus antarcticus]
MALALNEVAVYYGKGHFFYLPSRLIWRHPDKEPLLPFSRVPHRVPEPAYPSLVYMHCKCPPHCRTAYYEEGNRGRYLKCNAPMGRPADATPLYAIQYAQSSWD